MTIQGEIIRERIAANVLPADLALAAGLIEDSLAPGADLAAISVAITNAKVVYAPLFTAARTTTTAEAPANETLTAKVAREHRQQRQAPATAPASDSNPYAPATRNLTQQVLLESRDPTTAARLQAEAGAR